MAPGTEWAAQHVCRDAPCWRIDLQPGWEEAAPVWRQAGVLKQLCDGKGAAEGRGAGKLRDGGGGWAGEASSTGSRVATALERLVWGRGLQARLCH